MHEWDFSPQNLPYKDTKKVWNHKNNHGNVLPFLENS